MTKTIDNINLYEWFGSRELAFAPSHFTKATTSLTDESKLWIQEKLIGRYSFSSSDSFITTIIPAFEDPKEAVFYELTWG